MSDVKALENSVVEAENRVKSLVERSMGLGGESSEEIVEEAEEAKGNVVVTSDTPSKSKKYTPMIIGGVALLGLAAFLMLRKKK